MLLTRVAGIPIRLHWSFLALFGGFLAFALVRGGLAAVALTFVIGGLVVGSVLLHELGHALAARYYGIGTDNITLYPFGGIASITGNPRSARQEFVIAIAGPAVNFGLFVILALLWGGTGWPALLTGAAINLLMGLFNLLPAFPMDGGRVLRAVLSKRYGWYRATDLAMKVGKVFAWIFTVGGVLTFSPSLVVVGLFLHVTLASERRNLVWMWTYARKKAPYGVNFR